MNTQSESTYITAEHRVSISKSANRKLRSSGFVPGTIYSKGTANAIAVVKSSLPKEHTRANVTELKIGDTVKTVLMREVQVHPLTDEPLHFDFQEVSSTDKVRVNVPLSFFGFTREQEKEGTLGVLVRYLDVVGKLSAIPSSIPVDVSRLKVGGSVRLFDLDLSKELRVCTGKGQNVALASLITIATA